MPIPPVIRSVFICGLMYMFTPAITNAQESSRNGVYVEWMNEGPVYSINYDRIIRQGERLNYSLSFGLSGTSKVYAFPAGIHFLTGASNPHHFEFGITLIPYIRLDHMPEGEVKKQTDTYFYVNPGFGYRYQAEGTGLFVKAIAGPSLLLDPPSNDFWNMDPHWYGYCSLGIGVSF